MIGGAADEVIGHMFGEVIGEVVGYVVVERICSLLTKECCCGGISTGAIFRLDIRGELANDRPRSKSEFVLSVCWG